jgi:uncharacterized membrane protein YeiH
MKHLSWMTILSCALIEAQSLHTIHSLSSSSVRLKSIVEQNSLLEKTTPPSDRSALSQLRGGGSATLYSQNTQLVLDALEVFGTSVFAFSGAVTAGKAGMDLLGMMIVSMLTATGGGTVRDLLLGATPVFWTQQPIFLSLCLFTTLLTYVVWPRLEQNWGWKDCDKAICVADAIGLAAFVVITTEKGNVYNLPPFYWIVIGFISCTFGGILRDILCARPARVLYPNRTLYATPVLLGSAVYTLCKTSRLAHLLSNDQTAALTFCTTLVSRLWAFDNPIRLPHWKSYKKEMETQHAKEH